MKAAIPVLCLGMLTALAWADEQAEAYLRKGRLAERLEVLQLQGGFAGFTGSYMVIEPTGDWATGQVLPRDKRDEKAIGKLTPEQLVTLAKALARHDLANLSSHGQPVTNPAITRIRWGDRTVELQPQKQDAQVAARYQAIVEVVKKLTTK